ncbi:MAG: DUF1573 domain-containing protein [Chitinophagaceae bacterium]
MKKIFFAVCLMMNLASFAQSKLPVELPVEFKTLKHSFGNVKQGVPVTTEFSFTNKSEKPVVIEVATADCGCTSPEYPKEPIMKGKTANIKVTYNAATAGHFEKNVTVKFANISQPIILKIDGDVVAQPTKG